MSDADLGQKRAIQSGGETPAPHALLVAHKVSQYLTAVFELRPSRRKASVLEFVRSTAEDLFWEIVSCLRSRAERIAAITDPKERKTASRNFMGEIARTVLEAAVNRGLCEPVARGLIRDITSNLDSYIEVKAAGLTAEWPTRIIATKSRYNTALDALKIAATSEDEGLARDAMRTVSRVPEARPLVIGRSRDARLLRREANGSLVVILHILSSIDPRAKQVEIDAGIAADTGESTEAMISRTRLVVPVACSKWHEQKFLSGNTVLRSSLIRRVGNRWFMCAQFERRTAPAVLTGALLGVDRGVVNPVATAVVAPDGRILATPPPAGREIGRMIREADERRKAEQRRRGDTSVRHVERVGHALHKLANQIVSDAKAFGARVVIANLDGLKQVITTPREKGARKGGPRRSLKKAQLGKLERMLNYKLSAAGMPAPRVVFPAGTSRICLACGHNDPNNRQTQARFLCTSCGFEAHADTVGAVNIARRGAALAGMKKGVTLVTLEQNMVARLKLRGDTGLGPLRAELRAVKGVVAARAAAGTANDPQGLTVPAGQKLTRSTGQNARSA